MIEYQIIAQLFDKLSSTTKRLEKTELISRLFRSILFNEKKVIQNVKSIYYIHYIYVVMN